MIGHNLTGAAISHYTIFRKLGEGGMPSFREKYNNLVPQGGRRSV